MFVDWPSNIATFTLIVGCLFLMIKKVFGQPGDTKISWGIVLFVIVSAFVQISILGRWYEGQSESGLLILDGLNTSFAFAFLMYCLFSHMGSVRISKEVIPEMGLAQILFVFNGCLLLTSNSLLLFSICLPTHFIVSSGGYLLHTKSERRSGNSLAITKSLVAFVAITISSMLLASESRSFSFNKIEEALAHGVTATSVLGVTGLFLGLFMVMGGFPISLFDDKFRNAKSWHLVGFFGAGSTILGTLLIIKTVIAISKFSIVDGQISFASSSVLYIFGGISAVVFLFQSIPVFFSNNAFVLTQTLVTTSAAMSFLGLCMKDSKAFEQSEAFIYITIFATVGMFLSLALAQSTPADTLEGVREKLRKAPVNVQLLFFGSALALFPSFTYCGLQLTTLLIKEATLTEVGLSTIAWIIIGIVFLLRILAVTRVIELFSGDAKRNSTWSGQPPLEKVWIYCVFGMLLILGIYPTPIYKYLSHSINLFIRNAG